MCDTCYQRGYEDFPKWVGSVPHQDDYERGFQARQKEEGYDAECVDERDFCQKCFDRGYEDAQSEYWSPPSTQVRGHRESYEIGYYKDKNDAYKREQEDLQNRMAEEQALLESQRMYERSPKSKGFIGYVDDFLNAIGINRYNDYLKYILSKFLVIGISIGLALALALWIALILISATLLNLGLLGLLFAFILAEGNRRNQFYLGISIIGIIYILFDYNNGWISDNLSTFPTLKWVIFYLNVLSGLVAIYFMIAQNYFSNNSFLPIDNRKIVVLGSLTILGLTIFGLQKYHDDKTFFGYNISQATSQSSINSSIPASDQAPNILKNEEKLANEGDAASTAQHAEDENQRAETKKAKIPSNVASSPTPSKVKYVTPPKENREEIIRQLLSVDDERDETKLASFYSDNVETFWHLTKPTKEQILSLYKSRWKRQLSSINKIENITKINDATYKIDLNYQYTKVGDMASHNVKSAIVIKFDGLGKIISVIGKQNK